MRKRYIIGGIIITGFLVAAILSFNSNKIEYAKFAYARESGKTVQVVGTWEKEKTWNFDVSTNVFEFRMKDENGEIAKVVYSGGKPPDFDMAPMFVAKGKFIGGIFIADNIVTSCPSKYQTSDE